MSAGFCNEWSCVKMLISDNLTKLGGNFLLKPNEVDWLVLFIEDVET